MKRIDQDVDISNLYLTELPEFLSGLYINGNFYCSDNPIKFTEEQVRSVCDVKGSIFV